MLAREAACRTRGAGYMPACGLVALLLVSPLVSAHATEVRGAARVIDGDTLAIGETTIRLAGIDAPEMGQSCQGADSKIFHCGQAAGARLRTLTDGKEVRCSGTETDAFGRLVATCATVGVTLNTILVREGHAWAFVRYAQTYVSDEAAARANKIGVFASANEPPWEYRARRWQAAQAVPPVNSGGCTIKGNITREGERIYHLPWQVDYGRTRIDSSHGERWFCNETEAVTAGWRKATR